MSLAWAPITLWLMGAQASASEEDARARCPEPQLDVRQMEHHLGEARRALEDVDLNRAGRALSVVGNSLPCLTTVVPRPALARFARLMAETAFYRQERQEAVRWGLVAQLADPDHPWPALAADHPLRERLAQTELPLLGTRDGFGLAPPPGGAVFLNGELTLVPEARAELPYLVQLLDADVQVVAAYWQDGATFPEQLLVAEARPYPQPAWVVNGRVVTPQRPSQPPPRQRQARRFPLVPVVAGGALAVASAATYSASSSAWAAVPDAGTSGEADKARGRANTLGLISGITAAGAVGVGVGGILLTPTGARLSMRF